MRTFNLTAFEPQSRKEREENLNIDTKKRLIKKVIFLSFLTLFLLCVLSVLPGGTYFWWR